MFRSPSSPKLHHPSPPLKNLLSSEFVALDTTTRLQSRCPFPLPPLLFHFNFLNCIKTATFRREHRENQSTFSLIYRSCRARDRDFHVRNCWHIYSHLYSAGQCVLALNGPRKFYSPTHDMALGPFLLCWAVKVLRAHNCSRRSTMAMGRHGTFFPREVRNSI